MSEIVKSRYQGILIPDERFSVDNLTADDHASAPSDYTQAGPKPGVPEAQQTTRMVLQASGEQPKDSDIEIHSVRAGHPGLERAGYLWRDATEDDSDSFGWDGPQLLSGWESLFWSDDSDEKAACPDSIRLQSGKLLALGLQDKTTYAQTVKRYDPDATPKWSTAGTITLDTATEQKGPTLCQLPSGRVLAFVQVNTQVDVYFSDDDGDTWAAYAYRALDVPVDEDAVVQLRARYSGGEVLLLIQYTTPLLGESAAQYASDSLGAQFTQVTADWGVDTGGAEEPAAIDIVPLDGGFLVTFCDTVRGGGDGEYRSRRIGSAFENITDTTAVAIADGPTSSYAPACTSFASDSYPGVIFFIYTNPDAAAKEDLTVYRSDDSGSSWVAFAGDGAFFSGDFDNGRFLKYKAEEVAGQIVLLSRWASETADEDPQSLAAVYLGGFSTHTGPAAVNTINFQDLDYVAFNKNSTDSISGGSWLPIANPGDVAWTASGAGSDTLTSGKLEIVTAAQQRFFYREMGEDDDTDRIFAEFALEIDDGDGDVTLNEVGALLLLGDGVDKWEVVINVASTGWALYDVAAASQIGATVTEDMTKSLNVRVALEQGKIKTWYARRQDVTFREFTEGPGGTVTSTASTDRSRIQWGHSHSDTNTSRWEMVGYCFWPGRWSPTADDFAAAWTTPDDLHPKSYSTQPSQLVDKLRIAAVAGPTRHDEKWRISTAYTYPDDHLFPAQAPSPRAAWRSTDTTEQILAWDISGLSSSRMENTSLGCVLLGINFKTAYLEKKEGAVWSTVCTINAAEGFESLRFTREGEVVFPETGGSAHKAGRYVMYDELPGGTFYDDTNGKYRKIETNTEGAWTDEDAKHPFVTIEGADDTEASSGDCEIWAPNAAGLAHSYTSDSRFYRLRIPAQTTADGYFEIGQMVIGPLAVFGTQYGRGRQIVARNNTEQIVLPNGEVRARKRGPQSREVEFAWVDGVDASQINKADPVPDYVAAAVGQEPMASLKDTLYLMDGVIRRQNGAGKPVVYFARITADSTDDQTNNPREFVYGRITSSATRSNILGDEERTDLDRLNTITIKELV
jgi:hypothetical protein